MIPGKSLDTRRGSEEFEEKENEGRGRESSVPRGRGPLSRRRTRMGSIQGSSGSYSVGLPPSDPGPGDMLGRSRTTSLLNPLRRGKD